ncbi:glutathione S-transferase N-terminal domain-containing protein [Lysobacter sp. A03]|uniref:glutathione S-transferase family protein n=1 Tax=Lysobacter sp. A03 TaxID=1199154 RepID=UPI0005B74CE3|nr:glutathione S-transferase N-terminal domain-containing protein [Lysobacter sp. A03]KIQ96063.1 Glutathione S-transferase [Lysobacter sp. A03]
MKLYTKPGSCSTADHIALEWTGQPYEVEVMTAQAMKSPEYLALNPSGTVPTLVDGDFVLTQNAAIMGYIADSYPDAGLIGDGSARQRAIATRWLAFVNADLHPAFNPLFAPARFHADAAQHAGLKTAARGRVRDLFKVADAALEGRQWLAGFRSHADAYFYMTLRWAGFVGIDMTGLDNLAAYRAHMDADEGVQAVLKAEGLS